MGQANLNIRPIIKEYNWDLLDAQFWFRKVQDKNYREKDGVHWVRFILKTYPSIRKKVHTPLGKKS